MIRIGLIIKNENDMDNKYNIEKKLSHFKDSLKKEYNNGRLWLEYADFLDENIDDPHKTVSAYRKAQELLPDKDLRLRLGVALSKAGQDNEAIQMMKESLAESQRAYGYCMLSYVYLNCEQNDNAISACNTAIGLDPDYEEAYFLLGQALSKKSPVESIKCYRKAIQIDPGYQLAWKELGFALIAKMSTIQEGVVALKKAIQLNPHDCWAQIYLAYALWRIGIIDEAGNWYKSAIKICPEENKFRKWYSDFINAQEKKSQKT
jgi:tetratricopeptide (TPR) repeat protein